MYLSELENGSFDLRALRPPRVPFDIYMKIVLQRFGHLFALGPAKSCGETKWMCHCDCGNWALAKSYDLLSGRKQSCGCRRVTASRDRGNGHTRHPLYRHWIDIKTRCFNLKNPASKNHGRIGVTMYEPWRWNFAVFCEDVLREAREKPSPRHTLDRVDPFGNYEPGNIRWLTKAEQNANKRNSKPVVVGCEKMVCAQFASRFGFHPEEVSRMLELGMTGDQILATRVDENSLTTYVEV